MDNKHKETGTVLMTFNDDSLVDADLAEALLEGADLHGVDHSGAKLKMVD